MHAGRTHFFLDHIIITAEDERTLQRVPHLWNGTMSAWNKYELPPFTALWHGLTRPPKGPYVTTPGEDQMWFQNKVPGADIAPGSF
jgi:hypothetical protein